MKTDPFPKTTVKPEHAPAKLEPPEDGMIHRDAEAWYIETNEPVTVTAYLPANTEWTDGHTGPGYFARTRRNNEIIRVPLDALSPMETDDQAQGNGKAKESDLRALAANVGLADDPRFKELVQVIQSTYTWEYPDHEYGDMPSEAIADICEWVVTLLTNGAPAWRGWLSREREEADVETAESLIRQLRTMQRMVDTEYRNANQVAAHTALKLWRITNGHTMTYDPAKWPEEREARDRLCNALAKIDVLEKPVDMLETILDQLHAGDES